MMFVSFLIRILSSYEMNFQVLAAIIFGSLGLFILIRSGNKVLEEESETDPDSNDTVAVIPNITTFSDNPTIA